MELRNNRIILNSNDKCLEYFEDMQIHLAKIKKLREQLDPLKEKMEALKTLAFAEIDSFLEAKHPKIKDEMFGMEYLPKEKQVKLKDSPLDILQTLDFGELEGFSGFLEGLKDKLDRKSSKKFHKPEDIKQFEVPEDIKDLFDGMKFE